VGGPPQIAEKPEIQAYEEYNMIAWLAESAPECLLAKTRLNAIQQEHPEFMRGEHPDMDAWIGPATFAGWESPRAIDELLSKTPEEQLDFLISYEPKNAFDEPSRRGLIQQITAAVARDFTWGMRLARALAEKELWNSDIWGGIVEGWRTSVTKDEWQGVLQFLSDHDQMIGTSLYSVAHLLDDGIEKPDRIIPDAFLNEALSIAKKAWKHAATAQGAERESPKDWLFVALNDPAGTITMFFLRVLSKVRKESKEWKGIPDEYQQIFASIISDDAYPAQLGRVMLASQILFLFSSDETWTAEHIVPLFKWSRNPRRALRAWHGYLGWGQWTDSLLQHMMANYEETFPVLHSDFGDFSDRLCSHLASIAVLSSIDPLQHGWLNRFLLNVKAEEREMWASSVATVLRGTKENSKAALWSRWIHGYWQNRIQGIPTLLSASESGIMARWLVHLEPVFPKAVEVAISSPVPSLKHEHIFYELANSSLPKTYPLPTSKLLLFLLRGHADPFWACDYVATVIDAILTTTPTDKAVLLLVCDELARLGCGNAATLKARVQAI
jgi:hypothetical protein